MEVATLELANLRARPFRGVPSAAFSVALREGERLLVVGGCGAGKTALAQEVAGLRASDGAIRLNRADVSGMAPRERALHVGYLPTDSMLLFSGVGSTVHEEVAIGWAMMGGAPAASSSWFEELSELLEVEPLLHRDPFTLSGGERVRVALLLVLMAAPRLLVVDDAFGALDADMRLRARAVLQAWQLRFAGIVVEFLATAEGSAGAEASARWNLEPASCSEFDGGPTSSAGKSADLTVGLQIEDLRFQYEPDGFAMHLPQLRLSGGCIHVVEGPNGSGKSTLMKCVGLLQRPSFKDFAVVAAQAHRPPSAQNVHLWPAVVAYGFQDSALQLYCATVDEELRQTAKNLRIPVDKEDCDRLVLAFGLAAHLGQPTANLPLPLKRLVLIASLLLCRTPVLLLDEPTVSLDAHQKKVLRWVLQHYVSAGRLVVMVSHDHDFVAQLGSPETVASFGEVTIKRVGVSIGGAHHDRRVSVRGRSPGDHNL